MSEQQTKYVLALPDTIRKIYYEIYHYFDTKVFDYNKLKGMDKIHEDGLRTAFFAGFHAAEKHYELQKILDSMNDKTPKESIKE